MEGPERNLAKSAIANGDVAPAVPRSASRRPKFSDAAERRLATSQLVTALSLGLALVVIFSKLALLPFPVSSVGELARWALRLSIIVSADLLFVAALGAVALASGNAIAGRAGVWRMGRWLTIGSFQLAGLYAVASVSMFRMTMVPLSLPLLSFGGGPELFASSLTAAAPVGLLAAAAAVPLALTAAAWLAAPHLPRLAPRRALVVATAAVAMVTCYAGVSRAYIARAWTDPNRWERRISASPHSVLLASCVEELLKPASLTLSFEPTEIDDRDFQPASAASRRPPTGELAEAARKIEQYREGRPPLNLILIVLESVGVEYLDLYGASYDTMPQLAKRAREQGIVFENVYAHAPSSPKGLIALSCSALPRVDWRLITRDCPDFDVPTLPQVLKSRGYRSAFGHSGFWSWKNRDRFLTARGVDQLLDASTIPAERVFSWGIADHDLLTASLEWIDQAPAQPFQLLLWTIETHHPYVVSGPERDFGVADPELNRYLNALSEADRLIARLYASLAERGLEEQTVVAITGDHGEGFGQHNQRVHSFGIYEENVHVPWIVLHPALKQGVRMSDVCRQVDIPATLAGMSGTGRPDCWQGRNVLDEGPAERAYFYSMGNEVLVGLRDGKWKYHYHIRGGHEELFDLEADADELTNVAESNGERCGEYRRRVSGLVVSQRAFLASHGAP